MKWAFLCIMVVLVGAYQKQKHKEECFDLTLRLKGASSGHVTTKPRFEGLYRRSFNKQGKCIGVAEECVPLDGLSSTLPFDELHVTTFKLKKKGTLVVSSIRSVFEDAARRVQTGRVLAYTGTLLPGESSILTALGTKHFDDQSGYCTIHGVLDLTQFLPTVASGTYDGMVVTLRVEYHCKLCCFPVYPPPVPFTQTCIPSLDACDSSQECCSGLCQGSQCRAN
eukprot:TRINITY_DN28305_c0_g1_i1.p1 TRINITY_DN28305_c0_g1~~TRINITY_DN28305_c0_g1_i1.p1  ORF type:complete len:224 (-),score=13.55 TRINITY_DN28305_c0_g1_i1:23-694(-)